MILIEFYTSWSNELIKIRRDFSIHPFIFILFLIFHVYINNYNEYTLYVIIKPLFLLLLLTAFVLFTLNKFIKNYHKTGVILSTFYLWFFSYSPLRNFFESINLLGLQRHRYMLIIYILLVIIVIISLAKIRINFQKLSKYFNIVSFVLLLSVLINCGYTLWSVKFNFIEPTKSISLMPTNAYVPTKNKLPNIYYIILDSYTGERELNRFLNYDNSKFIKYLHDKGFFVASASRSNYSFTRFSMAATLNLDYLPKKSAKKSANIFLLNPDVVLPKMIKNNEVIKFLRSIGYRYIDLSIWNDQYNEIQLGLGLLDMTILSIPGINSILPGFLYRSIVLDTLNSLESLQIIEKPAFIYTHILIPHSPYMFDQYGKKPPLFSLNERELYIGHIKYINNRIENIVNNILSKDKTGPVIIIQGDHGTSAMVEVAGSGKQYMEARVGILNAIYFPYNGKKVFYETVSSVNTFRIIFNELFKTNYMLLPDISYYQDDENGTLFVVNPN